MRTWARPPPLRGLPAPLGPWGQEDEGRGRSGREHPGWPGLPSCSRAQRFPRALGLLALWGHCHPASAGSPGGVPAARPTRDAEGADGHSRLVHINDFQRVKTLRPGPPWARCL